jgi:hypothetical protein
MRGHVFASLALTTIVLMAAAASADPIFQWDDQHDGGGNYTDDGNVALVDPQGNLIVGGESTDTIAGSDMLIRKLGRGDGAEIWSVRWSADDGNDMAVTDMCWDPFDDVLVGGYIRGCVG